MIIVCSYTSWRGLLYSFKCNGQFKIWPLKVAVSSSFSNYLLLQAIWNHWKTKKILVQKQLFFLRLPVEKRNHNKYMLKNRRFGIGDWWNYYQILMNSLYTVKLSKYIARMGTFSVSEAAQKLQKVLMITLRLQVVRRNRIKSWH